MSVETGFELQGKFWMTPDDPLVMDVGYTIHIFLAGVDKPVVATVTKAYIVDDRKYVHFATAMVTKIQPEWATPVDEVP